MSPMRTIVSPVLLLALAAGCSREVTLPSTPVDSGDLVATISHGDRVELADHLAPGEWTVFEFTADW